MSERVQIRALLVEDSPTDALFLREALSDVTDVEFSIVQVEKLADAVGRLAEEEFDVVLLDLGLPDSQGPDTLHRLRGRQPDVPVVVLTGLKDEEAGIQAVRAGAQDYLVKGDVSAPGLVRVLRYGIERKRVEAMRSRLAAIVESSDDAIIGMGLDRAITDWNAGAQRLYGFSPEEALGQSIFIVVPPERRHEIRRTLETITSGGLVDHLETTRLRKDGTTVEVSVTVSPIRNGQGRVIGASAIARDITARRRAEEQTRLYDLLVSYSRDVILFIRQADGRILNANAAAERAYGYGREELLALSIYDLRAADTLGLTDSQMDEANVGGILFETVHRRKDGSAFPVEVSSQGATIEGTRILLSVVRDITDRKVAEEMLQQVAEQRRLALEAAELGAWDYRFDVGEVSWDERCRNMYGFRTGAQIDYTAAIERIHPEDRQATDAAVRQAINGAKGGSYHQEYRVVWPDGTVHWISSHGRVYFEVEGEKHRAVRFTGVNAEITELKQAEEAVRKSELRHRELFEHMSEGLAYCQMLFENGEGRDFIYLSVNGAFETLTGLKDVTGKRASEAIPGIRESDPALLEIYARVALTGTPEKFEMFVDALKMWFYISVYSPEKEFFVAVFDVITERKQAEEALHRSQRVLAQAEHLAHLGAWESRFLSSGELDENSLHWSDEAKRIFGYEPGPVQVSHQLFLRHVHPEDRTRVRDALQKSIADHTPYTAEHRLVRNDGTERTVVEYAELLYDECGQLDRVVGTVQDITERKRAEEERTRLVTAIEQCAETVMITDPEGTIQYVNPAFSKVSGYSREEAIGHNPRLLKSGKHDASFYADFWNTLLAGKIWHGEMVNRRKDGSFYTDELSVAPVRDGHGKIIHFISNQLDITERKRAEEQAKRLSHRIELILEAAVEGVFGLNEDGVVTFANPAAARILGYERDELIGQHSHALWHYARADGTAYPVEECPIYRTLRTGDAGYGEDWFWRQDGRGMPVQFAAGPIEESGRVAGAVVTFTDITERKRTEEEIRQLNAGLEQRVRDRTALLTASVKELEAFTHSVSHDLRAPVRHLNGFAELLRKSSYDGLDEKAQRHLDKITSASRGMGILIDDLLKFSRLGRTAMSKTRVALREIVQEVCCELEPETTGRRVAWQIDELPEVYADRLLLHQVLFNLMSNAVKYTRAREEAQIEIGAINGSASEEVIYVRDNGAGFEMAYVDKLFKVFQRLHSEEFEGTGVGLANVQRIVERHGGRVWAEGSLEQGATFYFSLPARREDRPRAKA